MGKADRERSRTAGASPSSSTATSARITHIRCTLDSHNNFQIFFPWFWVDSHGEPLAPHTLITVDGRDAKRLVNTDPLGNVLKEDVNPNPAITSWVTDKGYDWLVEQCRFYNRELAAGGRYTLYLWPPHCLVGSPGHTVTGVVDEARTLHSLARASQSWGEIKGTHSLTENYSVLRPEVLTSCDGGILAERNVRFYRTLVEADALIRGRTGRKPLRQEHGAGPAGRNPAGGAGASPKKVYIMTDCMSSVAVRTENGDIAADFTESAEQTLDEAASAGMHLVRSTEPMESWPGM